MTTSGPEPSLDTIIAEATPPGRGGVAVLRLSGPDAHALALRLFSPASGRAPRPRRCVRGHVRLPDGTPDEALCTLFAGPASFTGEDVAELGLHGSPWVIAAQLEAATEAGARLARPGEFAYRAWRNGRLDLTRAEALDSLIRASSPAAAAEAARQADGSLLRELETLRELLLDALAELEAAVDFHDDSVGQVRIDETLGRAAAEARRRLAGARRSRAVQDGLRVVLSGPPNAGKSSLFNALLAADRAIVTDEPGTTRDVLEGHLVLEGLPLVLLDTAGDREAPSAAEAEGVRRARAAREGADLVLEVRDASLPGAGQEAVPDGCRLVLNKADRLSRAEREGLGAGAGRHLVSALDGEGLDELLEDLLGACREACAGEGAVLLAARQQELGRQLREHLERAVSERGEGRSEELVAESVRAALESLEELAGATDPEALYDRVFARFCIGK